MLLPRYPSISIIATLALVIGSLLGTPWLFAQPPLERIPDAKEVAGQHLDAPFWRSSTIHAESIIFFREKAGEPAIAKLLRKPSKVERITSADRKTVYEIGKDIQWDDSRKALVASETATVPVLTPDDLYPAPKSERSYSHKAGDPSRWMLFDNGHWFHDQQIEVTYQTTEKVADSFHVAYAGDRLPKTIARLQNKQPLKIAVSGDSISAGLNASGFTGAEPNQGAYPNLVTGALRAKFGSDVSLNNRAIGGWAAGNGLADLEKLLASEPDLLILAYGMNDVGGKNPAGYRETIQKIIQQSQAARPNLEIILVATMLGNDNWVHTPREMFPKYREALVSLTGDGIVLADMTSLWTEMLTRKRDFDLTGNGLNHPNDFGHRLYASVILDLLVKQ